MHIFKLHEKNSSLSSPYFPPNIFIGKATTKFIIYSLGWPKPIFSKQNLNIMYNVDPKLLGLCNLNTHIFILGRYLLEKEANYALYLVCFCMD